MSHYTVAVITKDGDYEKALAPFSEHLAVKPYIKKTKADIINDLREQYANTEKQAKEQNNDQLLYFLRTHYDFTSDNEALFQSYKKCNQEYGYTFDEDGNQLTTYNPDSKWDWYSVGGRWDCEVLKLKTGEGTNHAQVKDIDFSQELTDDEVRYHTRFWQINVEGDNLREGENKNDYFSLYRTDYLKNRYESLENYLKELSEFNVHSVLLHGEWIEAGEMVYFGVDNATIDGEKAYRKRLAEIIANLDPNDYITIVDCHI